jgi:thiamine-monophosphate kinase
MKEDLEKKSIESLGEFGLINHLTAAFNAANSSTVLGIGDDCAVIERDESTFTLVSSDLFLENIHFDLMYVPLKHLGYKAISASISDVYAMNGMAEQVVVNIGLSSRFPLEAIEELYEGIQKACEHFQVDLVGGDTSSSSKGLMLSVTAIGKVEKSKISYRKGAKTNDIIMVSGDLGRPYLGLQILEREKSVFLANPNIQPELAPYDPLIKKQLMPEARKDVISLLQQLGVVPSAMIDISDGLASELKHLCAASNLGCIIHEEKLPYHEDTMLLAPEFNLSPLTCAMNGGEEYELLFSVSQKDFLTLKGNPHFTPIGYFTEEHGLAQLMDQAGSIHEIKAQGWAHF